MSTSVFKGAIGTGRISAKFMSDFSNVDSDLAVISYAEVGGGNPQVDLAAAVPGGFAEASVNAPKKGVLEVFIVTGQATDSGRLTVSRDGTTVHEEAIQGSVRWVYAVGA
jgi:hypothetical protein